MKINRQRPHVCPSCGGTGEEPSEFDKLVDDMTQVNLSMIDKGQQYENCETCGGEGVVYEKIKFNDNKNYGLVEQQNFVTDDMLFAWCLSK